MGVADSEPVSQATTGITRPSADAPGVADTSTLRWLTHGTGSDRQPVYAMDGRRIIFSSNRSGNLDLWQLQADAPSPERLTDDPARDWDPALLADGNLLWSSDRSGCFEIWIADSDGSNPRRLSPAGLPAQNPSPTPDGRWIFFSTHDQERAGIWKVPTDGGEARAVVAGNILLPEVSPDRR